MSKKSYVPLIASAAFIVFALSAAGYNIPPANAQTAVSQARPAPRQTEANEDTLARQVMTDSVMVVHGMQFPKVAPAPNAKANQSCCQPYDTRNVNNVATIDIESPYNYSKNKDYPTDGPIQAVYSPPLTCWVISGYNRVVGSTNDPYYAFDDAQPANFHYVTSSEYQSVLQQMKSYVLNLNILDKYKIDLNLKLDDFVKNYGMYSNSISTSHGQVRHTARLKGRGWPNGRSWYHGGINVTETCCPPEVTDSTQLKTTLKSWVDQTVSKLPTNPVVIKNIKNSTLRVVAPLTSSSPEAAPSPTPTPEH